MFCTVFVEVCIKADSTEMVSHGVMSVLTKLAEESGGKVNGGEWEVEDGGARATRRRHVEDTMRAVKSDEI